MPDVLARCLLAAAAMTLVGCAANVAPGTGSATSVTGGRSCGGVLVAHVDTAVDTKDSLLRMVQPTNGRLTPRYPTEMRASRISGRVVASFIVDTLGRVPPGGVWIQLETQPSFGYAVCDHLFHTHFAPLVVDGRRMSVRVLNWITTFDITG